MIHNYYTHIIPLTPKHMFKIFKYKCGNGHWVDIKIRGGSVGDIKIRGGGVGDIKISGGEGEKVTW